MDKICSTLGVPTFPARNFRRSLLAKGTHLDLPLLRGLTGIILQGNPLAVGRAQESTFLPFCMDKMGQNVKTFTPCSSESIYCAKKVDRPQKVPGPWTTMWSEQHLSAVHPLSCIPPPLTMATLRCDVWRKGNIKKTVCATLHVLCTIIMVHKGTSSSYRSVDYIGLWSCLV